MRTTVYLLGALSIVPLVWGCAEPMREIGPRPEVVPSLPEPTHAGTPEAAGAPGSRAVATAATGPVALSPVAAARVTEAEVIAHVDQLAVQHGAEGLRALPPGDTLVDRLRYCEARILLGEAEAVRPELERLTADHPRVPLVWWRLGATYALARDLDAAERCTRRAHALAAEDGFATCPSLPSGFGKLLIARENTRDEGLRLLREQLAEGADYLRATAVLVDFMCNFERHAEAIVILDRALQRAPDQLQLQVEKARVCVDLHRGEDALALLQPLVAREDAGYATLDAMVRVRQLRLEYPEILPLVDRMLALPGLGEKDRTRLQARRGRAAAALKEGGARSLPVWQVEAIVRGHPDLPKRAHYLQRAVAEGSPQLRASCQRIAWRSEVAAMRANALLSMVKDSEDPLVLVRAGLADRDGSVRGTAALLARGLRGDRDQAAGLLREQIGLETDPYAFRQLHETLVVLTGLQVELPYGAAEDPDRRREIAARWRSGK